MTMRFNNHSLGALVMVLVMAALVLPAPLTRAAPADKRADALFETAMSAYKLERFEDAATTFYDFMATAPYDPRSDQAQYYVGRAQMHRNYLNKAIDEFSYLVDDFPDSPYTTLGMHDIAQCFLKTRQPDEAVKWMEKVIEKSVTIYQGDNDAIRRQLYENHRQNVFWLAKHYLADNKHEAAIATYRRLPDEIEAFGHVVNVYYALKDFAKIRDLIDTLQDKNRHQGFKFLIEFYGKSKAFNQLKDIFAKLLEEKDPGRETDDLVWTTADSFRHFGPDHWDWAMRSVSKHYGRLARKADYELARRHWEDINWQDDLELMVIRYKNGGDIDQILRWKGITLERHGRAEDARKDYRRIADSGRGHWYVAESWHGAYAGTKDLDKAIEEYVKLRTAFYAMEWAAMAQWRIGELYRTRKEVDKAVAAFRQCDARFRSVTIDGGSWTGPLKEHLGRPEIAFGPASLLALGDILRTATRYDDAILEYRALVAKYPKTLEASRGAYNTALCYEGQDDAETAIMVLKSVLRKYGKTAAGSDAHTRLEATYDIADTEVSDEVDFFESELDDIQSKNYLEDPEKMKENR